MKPDWRQAIEAGAAAIPVDPDDRTCIIDYKGDGIPVWSFASELATRAFSDMLPHIAEQIALQIEAELVCCDIYEHINSGEDEKAMRKTGDYHAICHWGGYAAAIARKAGRQ